MKILVLHRVPYPRIEYARGIDHEQHDVTYLGVADLLATLPADLRCERVERPAELGPFEAAHAWITRTARPVDRVIALSEYDLVDAARLREWLGIPGATLEQVRLVRDKVVMKEAVRAAGLRVPRFIGLAGFLHEPAGTPWRARTVLKPLSGASSEDVVIFETPAAAAAAISARRCGVARLDAPEPAIDGYEVEEFVDGDIVHFDGLVANREVLTLTASRYIGTCLGYAKGQPLGSYHFPVSARIRDWVVAALAAVGIRQGSFHLEAIEDGDELVFLEVGNRVGGADVVATFEYATGVHLPSEELRILLEGKPSRALPPTQPRTQARWHGWFVFPGHALAGTTYEDIGGIARFRGDPALVRWLELPAGAALPRRVTYSANEAPLAGIVAYGSWQGTRDWIDALFAAATQMREPAPPVCAWPHAVPAVLQ
ncbi:ATP-grasp domain-containing protein [Paraburkholderia terricola]|uniref:ATP-grasp domain-containing protein n=1 Tax=Paraburkholderia terricola TaxID=169427 RepID=UPI001FCA47B6|nr:ATP-grasp domain-containing protein [Paraburkholderia terricola]